MKTSLILLCLLVTLIVPRLSRANLVGPYTPDTNTLFLLHFDVPAGSSVITNLGIKGGNFITVTNTISGSIDSAFEGLFQQGDRLTIIHRRGNDQQPPETHLQEVARPLPGGSRRAVYDE